MANTNNNSKANNSNNNNNKTKSTSYIAIPQKLIYDDNLNTKAKYLYIILKKHSVSDNVNIGYLKLMESLKWTDKRGFKRYLKALKDNNYIEYEFEKVGNSHPLKIKLNFSKPFVQIDRELVDKGLKCITADKDGVIYKNNAEKGIIYLYTIEDRYRKDWGYSCPSREDICKILKLNNGRLTKIIKYYHDTYICEYQQGKIIDNSDKEITRRTRNRYQPNIKDKYGNRRYSNHKPKNYFFK
jgi:hypothetical protein